MKCRAKHSLASDKAHCKPSDEVKTNQWVCTVPLWLVGLDPSEEYTYVTSIN